MRGGSFQPDEVTGEIEDDFINVGRPPLQRQHVVIPQASVATLFSAPYVLVPGITGIVLLPEALRVLKLPGSAWTTSGSGTLQVRWLGTSAATFGMFSQTEATNFFDALGNVWLAQGGHGQFAGIGVSSGATNNARSKDLVLQLASADITPGTGVLYVDIWYRAWGVDWP